jgi:F-type H+-transporting ATPase subunit epsilon
MTAKTLFLEIVTPTGIVFAEPVQMVIAPAVEGTVGILANHTPFFTKLNEGELKIKKSDKEEFFTIYGGFMDVNPSGKVTIMTDGARRSEEISEETARVAKQQAEKLLQEKDKLSEVDFAKAESSLRKAILDLKVVQKRKRSR